MGSSKMGNAAIEIYSQYVLCTIYIHKLRALFTQISNAVAHAQPLWAATDLRLALNLDIYSTL